MLCLTNNGQHKGHGARIEPPRRKAGRFAYADPFPPPPYWKATIPRAKEYWRSTSSPKRIIHV